VAQNIIFCRKKVILFTLLQLLVKDSEVYRHLNNIIISCIYEKCYLLLQERLKLAQEELMETQRQLDKAKGKLAEVEEGIASLQAKYNECISKKEDLEFKTNQCTARLERAEKVHIKPR